MTERDWHQANEAEEAGQLCLLNLQAILDYWGSENVERLGREIYRFTECGAWLSVQLHDGEWRHTGNLAGIENGNVRALLVGSIVEGSDAEVTGSVVDLLTDAAYEEVIASLEEEIGDVNDEAGRLWEEANAEEEEDA